MTWRTYKHQFPNGREYWTVEDRATSRVVMGVRGGLSKFMAFGMAEAAVRTMKRQDGDLKIKTRPGVAPDDFCVVEPWQ